MKCKNLYYVILAIPVLWLVGKTPVSWACVPGTRPTNDAVSVFLPDRQVTLPKRLSIDALKLTFDVPGDFVAGRFARGRTEGKLPGDSAVVLVEAVRVGTRDPQKLQPGDLPMIQIERVPPAVSSSLRDVLKETWKTRIGAHDVFKLPNAPGPYGDNAHAYMVRGPAGEDVLLVAPKFSGDDGAEPTHYDWVIERIISSLTFNDK